MCCVWLLVPAALLFCGGCRFRAAGVSMRLPRLRRVGGAAFAPSPPPPPSASALPRSGPDLLRRPLPAQLMVQ